MSNTPKKIEMLCAPNWCPDVHSVTVSGDGDMLTVTGMVDPTTIMEMLRKRRIEVQPWENVRSRTSVDEEDPKP